MRPILLNIPVPIFPNTGSDPNMSSHIVCLYLTSQCHKICQGSGELSTTTSLKYAVFSLTPKSQLKRNWVVFACREGTALLINVQKTGKPQFKKRRRNNVKEVWQLCALFSSLHLACIDCRVKMLFQLLNIRIMPTLPS